MSTPTTPTALTASTTSGASSGRGSPRRRPVPRRALRSTMRVVVILVLGIPLLVGTAAASGFGALLFGSLPGTVPPENPTIVSEPSYVYDANGQQIATFREFDLSIPMTKEDIPQVLKDAVVAAEDRKFWTHKGIDPEGLVRAAITNYREGSTVQGGSTITQQYVKNTYLNNERSVERKLNEAVLATRLERDLTDQLGSQRAAKEEILYRYLNTVYFGDGAYGAAAAAQSYFRKDVKDLNASEAAALVAIIPSPTRFAPRENLFVAEERRLEVLGEMRDQGMISDSEYDDAKAHFLWPTALGDPGKPTTAIWPPPDNGASQYPYFVDYVRRYLLAEFDAQGKNGEDLLYRGGLRIQTTIDPHLQDLANAAVADAYARAVKDPDHPLGMSLVTVDPSNGFVKAMVGGQDFGASQVNLALGTFGGGSGVQAGSSMKPYTMATALEQGITPDTPLPATGAWKVPGCPVTRTQDCVINGEAASTMGPAIAESSNTYFAQLAYDVGPTNVAKMANRLGVTGLDPNKKDYGVGVTLGVYSVSPLDMAVGYSTFENHGVKNDPTPVVKVTDSKGTILEDNTARQGTRVLNAAIADTVTDLLRGPVTNGTASKTLADFGRPAAGKTGTTDNNADVWFVGYTPQLTTAVWIGHTDGIHTLRGFGTGPVFGGTVPAQIWKAFMKPALDGLPVLDFPVPGPLPPPGTGVGDAAIAPDVRRPNERAVPDLPTDCGGPCILTTPLTSPPAPTTTTSPPSTTSPSLPGSTTTTTTKGSP
ncbi:MAG: transglycosylase domain-containing protein [Acidimicrobiales bacterium]